MDSIIIILIIFCVFSIVYINVYRKEFYLNVISVLSVTEFLDFCVPDVLPITYAAAYIFSIAALLLIRLVQGFLNLGENSTINTLYILSNNLVIIVMYGLDVFVYNVRTQELCPERSTEVEIQGVDNPLRESIKKGISLLQS